MLPRLTLAALFVSLAAAPAALAQGRQGPSSNFVVEDDPPACSELRRVLKQGQKGDPSSLVERFQGILERAPAECVVAFSVKPADPLQPEPEELYLGVRERCRQEIAKLSGDDLAAYRERHDGAARDLYRDALARRSLDALRDLASKYARTSIACDLFLSIAELSMEEGDYDAAYVALDPIVQEPSRFVMAPGQYRRAALRLAQCARALGRWERLRALAAASVDADLPVDVGGERTTLRQALTRLAEGTASPPSRIGDLREARPWVFRVPTPPPMEQETQRIRPVVVWGGQAPSVTQRVVLWDASIEAGFTPSCAAAVSPPWVFVHDGEEGVVLDGRTGARTAWTWGNCDLLGASDATLGAIERSRLSRKACLHGSRLYATIESGWVDSRRKDDAEPSGQILRCSLYAFDLAREGYRLWDTERPFGSSEDDKWLREKATFVSPPVVHGGSVYAAAAELQNDVRLYLCAFDARTGALRWRTYLGAVEMANGNPMVPQDTTHRIFPGLAPLVAEGMVIYCTNCGGIAAVDAGNGEVRWLVKYGRKGNAVPRPDVADWGQNPLQACEGLVGVAPQDSNYFFAIDLATGQRVESRLFERTQGGQPGPQQFRYFVVLPGGRVVFVSDQKVCIRELGEPTQAWKPHPRSAVQPVALMEPALGRPLADGDDLYIPGAKALYRMRIDEHPQVKEFLRWPEPVAGGMEVLALDGGLVALTRDRIYGYAR